VTAYPIIDVDFISVVDDLQVGWAVWSCIATLDDGSTIEGTIQGDGLSHWDIESFEPDEDAS
jgi:hypothetical protein